jgi:competence protein ComEC
MAGGSRAARAVENSIWTARRSQLDAIVVSHADADHCNAIPELVDVVPTGTLLAHRTLLDWSQPAVATAIERAAAAGIRIRLIAGGQQIHLDPEVEIRVLHPAVGFRSSADNANSLVLCVQYAGRNILLTGDVDRDGLFRLLQSDRIDADILLAPHHGGVNANPRDLARWATPEYVISSCRDVAVQRRLKANYGPDTSILTTAQQGAIRCRIDSEGNLSIEPFKRRKGPD